MFLCAVARPRFDTSRNQWFDGKLGIWPFFHLVEAIRTSRNRPAGTYMLENLSVNKEVYRRYMATKVIPAIIAKWPQCHRNLAIKIQHDNAKAHRITDHDPEIAAVYAQTELDISLKIQPANSPDTNVLDLGFFNSIQSLQHRKHSNTTGELIKVVKEAFAELQREKLNKIFLTQQKVHEMILLRDGHNDYKLPHLRKDVLARQGQLPLSWPLSDELKAKVKQMQQPQAADEDAIVDEAAREAQCGNRRSSFGSSR